MTTFIKVKLKKSDDQINIDKCRVSANITEYHITKFILRRLSKINIFKMGVWTFWSKL